MKKENTFIIVLVIAIILELIIVSDLLYNQKQLKSEIRTLTSNINELDNIINNQRNENKEILEKVNKVLDKTQKELDEKEKIENDIYYDAISRLDKTVFLTDFENYNPSDNDIKVPESRAKQIAQIGFEESKRIAGEGTDNIESETLKIEEVTANNYFTRYYFQSDEVYNNIKRKCYAIQRENEMGCGVTIYVDVTTGLIIAGRAFGD